MIPNAQIPIIRVGGAPFYCVETIAAHNDTRRSRTDGIAIHHTGIDLPYCKTRDDEVAQIIQLATYDAGRWGLSSYHAYAFPSGAVYVVGDGTYNLPAVAYENDHLESIVMVGNYSTNPVPVGIILGVAGWVLAKYRQHQFMAVKGHRDWVNLLLHPTWATACPGDKGDAVIPQILTCVTALARNGN